MTEVNVPLLRKAVEWVEQQARLPEIDREWDQATWVSTPDQRAKELVSDIIWDANGVFPSADSVKAMSAQVEPACGTAYCVAGYIGQMLDSAYATDAAPRGKPGVWDFARDQLGISQSQADTLFDTDNDAEDVRYLAEQIVGGRL